MAEVFILAEVQANEFQREAVSGFAVAVQPLLAELDGFRSITVWRAAADDSCYLLVSHYADTEAAGEGLKVLADGHLLSDYVDSMTSPPDVRELAIFARNGVAPGLVNPGECVSISTQSPSNEEAATQDLEDVLAGLLYLEGCLGTAHGTNTARPGELIGLAFWNSASAYQASVPANPPYPVRLFRRIA